MQAAGPLSSSSSAAACSTQLSSASSAERQVSGAPPTCAELNVGDGLAVGVVQGQHRVAVGGALRYSSSTVQHNTQAAAGETRGSRRATASKVQGAGSQILKQLSHPGWLPS